MGLKRDLTVLGVMIIVLVSFSFAWTVGNLGTTWTASAVQYVDSPVVVSSSSPSPTNFVISNYKQVSLYLELNNPATQDQTISIEVQPLDANGDIVHNQTTTITPLTRTGVTVLAGQTLVLAPSFDFVFDHIDRYLSEFLIIITGSGYVMSWSVTNTGSSQATIAIVGYSTTDTASRAYPKAKLLLTSPTPWGSTLTLGSTTYIVKQVRTAFNPNWKSRFEITCVVLAADSTNTNFYLYAYVYDGLNWNGPQYLGRGTPYSGQPQVRPFDVAYEGVNSRAIVVWNNKYDGDNAKDLAYMIWDGIGWGDGTTYGNKGYINTLVSGESDTIDDFSYVRLEMNPLSQSNEIALAGLTKTSLKVKTFIWSGTSWGNGYGLCTTTYPADTDSYECFDIGYEYSTGRLIAVGGSKNGANYQIRFANYKNGTWTTGTPFTTGGTNVVINYLVLKPQRVAGAKRMMLLSLDTAKDLYARVYNGDAAFAGTSTLLNTNLQSATTRDMDGDWEPTGNKFLIVYSPNAATGTVTWRTWTPTTWSSATTSTISGIRQVYWVKVQTNLKNNAPLILVGTVDQNNQLIIMRWTGSAISSTNDGLFTNLSSTTYEGFGLSCSFP